MYTKVIIEIIVHSCRLLTRPLLVGHYRGPSNTGIHLRRSDEDKVVAFCGAGAPGADTTLGGRHAHPAAGSDHVGAVDEKYHPARNYQLDIKLSAREW